jgi:hypothetical protein
VSRSSAHKRPPRLLTRAATRDPGDRSYKLNPGTDVKSFARRSKSPIIALVALPASLLGCGSTAHALAHASYPAYSFSFSYPATWERFDCSAPAAQLGSMVSFLTTMRALPTSPCDAVPHSRLSNDGAFVSWSWRDSPALSISQFPGRETTLGGRAGRIETVRPGSRTWQESGCGRVGGQTAVVAAVSRARHSLFVTTACLRGPDLSKGEAAVRHMLASVRIH